MQAGMPVLPALHRTQAVLETRLPAQSRQPETRDCDDGDGGEEVPGEAVVAGGEASPVLHAAEHALDDVASAIGAAVKRVRPAPGAIGGDDDFRSLKFERSAQIVCIIGLVGEQPTRRCDAFEEMRGDGDVRDVAGCQDEGDRLALSVGQSVDLAGPPAT